MAEALLHIGLLTWAYATLWFVISLLVRRNDVADIAWGLGYVVICIYLFQTQTKASIPLLVFLKPIDFNVGKTILFISL